MLLDDALLVRLAGGTDAIESPDRHSDPDGSACRGLEAIHERSMVGDEEGKRQPCSCRRKPAPEAVPDEDEAHEGKGEGKLERKRSCLDGSTGKRACHGSARKGATALPGAQAQREVRTCELCVGNERGGTAKNGWFRK